MSLSTLRPVSQLRQPAFSVAGYTVPRKHVAICSGDLVLRQSLRECPNCQCKFDIADSDAYTECFPGFALCEPCVTWMGECHKCTRPLALAGDWDHDYELHTWAPDSAPARMHCSECRGEGMFERTIALGELNPWRSVQCNRCERDYSLEQTIPDGYTDDPLCPRCSAPCSLCSRQVLCDDESGVTHRATLRSRCAMCVTPSCTVCNIEVGLIAPMCYSSGDGAFKCTQCGAVQ